MERLANSIYETTKKVDNLKKELEVLEKKQKEEIMLLITESCTPEKKVQIPFPEHDEVLQIYARDYKEFADEVKLEIGREKKRFEKEISSFAKNHKSAEEDIKRKAEADGKVVTDRRWYSKIESANATDEDDE